MNSGVVRDVVEAERVQVDQIGYQDSCYENFLPFPLLHP